jgi:nucleoside diphosphate kinase
VTFVSQSHLLTSAPKTWWLFEMLIDGRFGAPISPGLTEMSQKSSLYSVDTYFWESWEDLMGAAGARAADLAHSHSLILIKPDAFAARKVEAIVDWLSQNGFTIVACMPLEVCRHQARALWRYQWNAAPRIRKEALTTLLAAASSMLLIIRSDRVSGVSTAIRFASMKGSADRSLQRPGDLRAVLSSPAHLISFVHAADDPADFVRELGILLAGKERRDLYGSMRDGAEVSLREILAVTEEAYQSVPYRSFDLLGAVERISAAAHLRLDAHDPDYRGVASILAEILVGRAADWPALFRMLDDRMAAYDKWDRITIAGHASDAALDTVSPLVPGVVAVADGEDVAWRAIDGVDLTRKAVRVTKTIPPASHG